MAFSELFVCDACGHDAVLVHADEWTPGPNGAILPYLGHGPVGGLANRLWCASCRAVRAFPFVVLDPPADHPVVAYAEAQRLKCDGRETGPCPVCQAPLTWALDGQPCPACADGVLRLTGEWEDAV
jgi:hypothetical protein